MSQHIYKRIFIIGHPGAGKALIAKAVAEKLGWKFIDADLGLEFRIGCKLQEILGKQGQDEFYNCQANILTDLCKKENIVVTTDASIVCNEKLRQLLSPEFVVYLQVSTPVQIERNSRQAAPLLLTIDMKQFLDSLHQERDDLYSQVSKLNVNSDDSAIEEHVMRIVKEILDKDGIENLQSQVNLEQKDLNFYHKTTHVLVQLSNSQALCLKLLAQGKSSKEISNELNISYRTVEGHIAHAMELLGCTSSKELIALYHDRP